VLKRERCKLVSSTWVEFVLKFHPEMRKEKKQAEICVWNQNDQSSRDRTVQQAAAEQTQSQSCHWRFLHSYLTFLSQSQANFMFLKRPKHTEVVLQWLISHFLLIWFWVSWSQLFCKYTISQGQCNAYSSASCVYILYMSAFSYTVNFIRFQTKHSLNPLQYAEWH